MPTLKGLMKQGEFSDKPVVQVPQNCLCIVPRAFPVNVGTYGLAPCVGLAQMSSSLVFRLESFPIHLGLGATAVRQPSIEDKDFFEAYAARHTSDGAEGRRSQRRRSLSPQESEPSIARANPHGETDSEPLLQTAPARPNATSSAEVGKARHRGHVPTMESAPWDFGAR